MRSSLILLSPNPDTLEQAYRVKRKLYVLDPQGNIPTPESEVEILFSPKDQYLGLTRVLEKVKEDFWLLGNLDIGLIPRLDTYEAQIRNYSRLAACHVSGSLGEGFREFVPYLGTWYSRAAMKQAGFLEEHLDYALMASRWGERATRSGWALRVILDPQAPTRIVEKPHQTSRALVVKPSPDVTITIAHWAKDLALLNTVLNAWQHQTLEAKIHIVDTGSPVQIRESLVRLEHQGIQVSALALEGARPEEYECLAFDYALEACQTQKLIFCHLDVVPQSDLLLKSLVDQLSPVQPILGIAASPELDLISTALVVLDLYTADSARLTASPRWLKNQYGLVNTLYPFLALNASMKVAGIRPKLLDSREFCHIEHVVKTQHGKSDGQKKAKTQEVNKAIQETLIRLSRGA